MSLRVTDALAALTNPVDIPPANALWVFPAASEPAVAFSDLLASTTAGHAGPETAAPEEAPEGEAEELRSGTFSLRTLGTRPGRGEARSRDARVGLQLVGSEATISTVVTVPFQDLALAPLPAPRPALIPSTGEIASAITSALAGTPPETLSAPARVETPESRWATLVPAFAARLREADTPAGLPLQWTAVSSARTLAAPALPQDAASLSTPPDSVGHPNQPEPAALPSETPDQAASLVGIELEVLPGAASGEEHSDTDSSRQEQPHGEPEAKTVETASSPAFHAASVEDNRVWDRRPQDRAVNQPSALRWEQWQAPQPSPHSPVNRLVVRMDAPESPVQVSFTHRAGELQVNVKAGDEHLAASLLGEVGSLVGDLQHARYNVEMMPAAAATPEHHGSGDHDGQAADRQQRQQQPGERQPRRQRRQPQENAA